MARRPALSDEEILARARTVFVERGFGARTKQIAAAVGLTWGAIILRFGDKRGLFTQAMAGPLHSPCESMCEQEDAADLPALLERLRTQLWERWPLRLQYQLALATECINDEPERLVGRLSVALKKYAAQGSIRSDVSGEALARIVLALLVGDVAQRFLARERTLTSDPAFIDTVVDLLSAG